jgi:hypothetical protein
MKKLLLIAAVIITGISCRHLQGSGNIISEKRSVGSFKGIDVGGAFEVEIKKGATIGVEVESDDNILPYITTSVQGDVLNIDMKSGTSINDGHYKIYITAPVITEIKAAGAATVTAKDVLQATAHLLLKSSGAAKIDAIVDAPTIKAEASGAATINVSGRTKEYDAEASGSANINSLELKSENTDASASGAANVHVHASVSLQADASGAGNISYTGNGTVNQHSSGAGSIKKVN